MIRDWFRSLFSASVDGWNRFWFTPSHPAALSIIRIATGTLLFYSHLIWALNSSNFFGPESWLNGPAADALRGGSYSCSLLSLIDGHPAALFAVHALALTASLCLTVGCFSRVAALATFVLTVSFANRNPAALYGFDQILGFVTLYLSVNPGHGWLSIDAWRTHRKSATAGLPGSASVQTKLTAGQAGSGTRPTGRRSSAVGRQPSVTIATRLIQLHLCLLYFVAGISKLKGATWWSGVAFWGAIGNQEYQTVNLTSLVHWPVIINLLTHVTLAWELSYVFVVWNRWLRPFVLAMAVAVHAGIGLCFGMMTFGMIMITANVAFVSPQLILQLAGVPTLDPTRSEPSTNRASRLHTPGRTGTLEKTRPA
ncbi:hypothetical protein GC176_06670 [bacterium]|nr:hypothetical protein [bacterium]